MITYDAGKWNLVFACQIYGSVFPKSLVISVPATALTLVLHYCFRVGTGEVAKEIGAGLTGSQMMSGFTFILGFLVVFRSQQAFARWWEGGTLLSQLRGEWFNAFSCLLAFSNKDPALHTEVLLFQEELTRLMSLLFASALSSVSSADEKVFEVIDADTLDEDQLDYLETVHDKSEVVLQWVQRLVVDADKKKTIDVAPPILSRVYNQLGNGIVNLANARKIRDFQIPFPLAQMITFMLMFHWCLTVCVCASSVDNPLWAGLICFVVTLSYWSINYIAVELEMPYGQDPNDLPLPEMQHDMNRSLLSLRTPHAQHRPSFRHQAPRGESGGRRRFSVCVKEDGPLVPHLGHEADAALDPLSAASTKEEAAANALTEVEDSLRKFQNEIAYTAASEINTRDTKQIQEESLGTSMEIKESTLEIEEASRSIQVGCIRNGRSGRESFDDLDKQLLELHTRMEQHLRRISQDLLSISAAATSHKVGKVGVAL
eukprot:TRINITY_DN26583_c0_g1_i1.p1 TRINITY_DN26583_c0_g1~~TRINITY_DN26583_c0_g1_i1.p1  ORF type:complete len:487 (-),score=67.92 TRINITY_DN26583_c0_g1_i1:177-1637(-)